MRHHKHGTPTRPKLLHGPLHADVADLVAVAEVQRRELRQLAAPERRQRHVRQQYAAREIQVGELRAVAGDGGDAFVPDLDAARHVQVLEAPAVLADRSQRVVRGTRQA